MSTSFEAKNTLVRDAQLKAQELVLPYSYAVDAGTPADSVVTVDDPSVLFIETESTSATGSTDISAKIASGETYTVAQAAVELTGQYSVYVHVQEEISKVYSVEVRERKTGAVIATIFETAPSNAIISQETAADNDAIVFSVDHGSDIRNSTVDAYVLVRYKAI